MKLCTLTADDARTNSFRLFAHSHTYTPNRYASSFKLFQQILKRSNALLVLSVCSPVLVPVPFPISNLLIERNTLFLSVMSIIRLRNLEIRFARLFICFILLWIKCRLEFYCLNNFHELIILTPEVFYMFVYMWTVNQEQYLSFEVETIFPGYATNHSSSFQKNSVMTISPVSWQGQLVRAGCSGTAEARVSDSN